MATSYKIRLKRFNGTDYDTLNLISDNIIMSSGNNLQTDYNNLDGAIDDIVYVGDDAPTDPNTKIWLDTDASGASAVNSVNGKAGTVVLDSDDVGAMSKMDLLWTNASPSSDFAAQTVALDLSSYDLVFIEYAQDKTNNDYYYSFLFRVDSKQHMAYGFYAGMMTRRFTTPSSTGVYFNVSQKASSYGSVFTNDNIMLIPINICGIKGVA